MRTIPSLAAAACLIAGAGLLTKGAPPPTPGPVAAGESNPAGHGYQEAEHPPTAPAPPLESGPAAQPAPADLPGAADLPAPEPWPSLPDLSTLLEGTREANPVVRFYNRGSRVDESESYREELRRLPLGYSWPRYEAWIRELGFEIVDAAIGPSERPRIALLKAGLLITLEITRDHAGRVAAIDAGPNL